MSETSLNSLDGVVQDGHDLSHGSVIHGDALEVLDELSENEFHAIVTDPPYAISFMDREWDQFRRQRNENDADRDDVGGRLPLSAPASGAEGDNYEYHRWCMLWAEKAKRVLKPGGHVIAFSGNRTHHRLMSAFEDVGYKIRDTVTWHYGEGFPKGPKLSTWLDGEDAEKWGDWRGTLKPATEFPILFRAPLGESSATQNQVEHGTGNLNVEAARLPSTNETLSGGTYADTGTGDNQTYKGIGKNSASEEDFDDPDGRYPPNVALDPVMAEVMDMMSGERSSGDVRKYHEGTNGNVYGDKVEGMGVGPDDVYADSGGASRFFYCSKAPKSERTHDGAVDNDHETVKPIDLMEWLIKLVTAEGQKVLDPFCGSGTTLLAADNVNRHAVGIEREAEYVEIAEDRWDAHTSES